MKTCFDITSASWRMTSREGRTPHGAPACGWVSCQDLYVVRNGQESRANLAGPKVSR